jgi:SAM-dependent methyltransferase
MAGHRHESPGGAYWDGVLADWSSSLAHDLWRAHSDAVNNRLIDRWLPSGQQTVLKTDLFDEAVGAGLYPALAGRAAQVVGVDVSPAVVREASARYPELDAHVGSVLALPFADGTFDAIVSNSTLDHFRSRSTLRAALVELARVIRPGGRLVVTLDNRMNPIVALRTSFLFGLLHRLHVVPYFVGATHGPRGLAQGLRESGFDTRELTAVMHCPPQLAAQLSTRWDAVRPQRGLAHAHLRRVMAVEALERLPSAPLTGHFVAALALRRSAE